jgi:hypothetical protein
MKSSSTQLNNMVITGSVLGLVADVMAPTRMRRTFGASSGMLALETATPTQVQKSYRLVVSMKPISFPTLKQMCPGRCQRK